MALELAGGLASTEAERLLQAEALVRSYCGWHIAPSRADVEVTLYGSDSARLFLTSLQVTAVTSVTLDGLLLTEGTDYRWESSGVITRLGSYWGDVPAVIVFTHGYAEAPPEVSGIVQSIATRALSNPGSLVRDQAGPFAATYSQTGFNQSIPLALLDAEKDVLAPYRIVSVA